MRPPLRAVGTSQGTDCKGSEKEMWFLLDSNVTAGYYLPRSLNSRKAADRISDIFDSSRSSQRRDFFYIPNFCIAEVFSVFMKHCFGKWNRHLHKKGTIDRRVYENLCKQFQSDIHNGRFLYHYELNRYHILGINLVAPIDHYFKITRSNKQVSPMGTFDHLIISMGIHLAHIHGAENVCILSTDDRLTDILRKCKGKIKPSTVNALKLNMAKQVSGKDFGPELFPKHLNLKTVSNKELLDVFGAWPLKKGKLPPVYRWRRL